MKPQTRGTTVYEELTQLNSKTNKQTKNENKKLNNLMEKQADTPSKGFSKEDAEVQQGQKKVLDITNPQGNANQNHNKMITSHLLECLSSKYKRASVGKGVERGTLVHLGGDVNWHSLYGKQQGSFSTIKKGTTI